MNIYKVLKNGLIKVANAVSHFVSNDESYCHFIVRPTDPDDPKYHTQHMRISYFIFILDML